MFRLLSQRYDESADAITVSQSVFLSLRVSVSVCTSACLSLNNYVFRLLSQRYDGPADGEQLTVEVGTMEVSKLTVIAFRPSSSKDTFSLAVDQLTGLSLIHISEPTRHA